MAKSDRKEMGKGIRALLSNIEKQEKEVKEGKTMAEPMGSLEIAIDKIEANPFQPRVEFNEEALKELATSIKTFGVIQPITVRRLSSKRYQIISGERRWRASKMAGLKAIPAYIKESDDQGLLEMALLENIQRTDLNPVEIALSYQRLIEECSLTHEALSERLGKKRSSVSNYLRILKLPPSVQKALQAEMISMGHAKVIAGLDHIEDQVYLLDLILRKGISVRQAESWKSGLYRKKNKSIPSGEVHPEIARIQDQLSEKLGKKVEIKRSSQGSGSIKIPFASDRDLNELMDLLLDV